MDQIAATLTRPGLVVACVAAAAACVVAFADRRARILLVMALLTWLPASVVYLSDRYLLLPSVAVCGILASALARPGKCSGRAPHRPDSPVANRSHRRCSGRAPYRPFRVLAGAFVIIWIAWQGLILFAKTTAFTKPRATQRTDQRLREMQARIPRGADVLLFNLSGDWLAAQFAEDQLRWTLDDPTLSVHVVTLISRDSDQPPAPRPHWLADDSFSLGCRESVSPSAREETAAESPVADNRKNPFDIAPFTPGEMISGNRLGFVVRITAGHDGVCTGAQFTLPKPIEHYTFVDLADPGGVITPPRQASR
jgi:hypothetical protein